MRSAARRRLRATIVSRFVLGAIWFAVILVCFTSIVAMLSRAAPIWKDAGWLRLVGSGLTGALLSLGPFILLPCWIFLVTLLFKSWKRVFSERFGFLALLLSTLVVAIGLFMGEVLLLKALGVSHRLVPFIVFAPILVTFLFAILLDADWRSWLHRDPFGTPPNGMPPGTPLRRLVLLRELLAASDATRPACIEDLVAEGPESLPLLFMHMTPGSSSDAAEFTVRKHAFRHGILEVVDRLHPQGLLGAFIEVLDDESPGRGHGGHVCRTIRFLGNDALPPAVAHALSVEWDELRKTRPGDLQAMRELGRRQRIVCEREARWDALPVVPALVRSMKRDHANDPGSRLFKRWFDLRYMGEWRAIISIGPRAVPHLLSVLENREETTEFRGMIAQTVRDCFCEHQADEEPEYDALMSQAAGAMLALIRDESAPAELRDAVRKTMLDVDSYFDEALRARVPELPTPEDLAQADVEGKVEDADDPSAPLGRR